MLVATGDQQSVAQRGYQRQPGTDPTYETDTKACRHALGFYRERFRDRCEDDLEQGRSKQCSDRIDKHAFRFKNGPQPGLQPHVT